jgi:hypothetical protein
LIVFVWIRRVALTFFSDSAAKIEAVLPSSNPSALAFSVDVIPVVFETGVGKIAIRKFLQPTR